MRISDWSADVCSSDLAVFAKGGFGASGAGWVVNREVFDMQKCTMKLWTVAAGAAAATTMAVPAAADRKSVVSGTRESVRVDLGGGRGMKTKERQESTYYILGRVKAGTQVTTEI